MKPFSTVDEILIFAVNAEQEAVDFYSRLSNQSMNTEMKQVFNQYAHEEMNHKARLMKIREQGIFEIPAEQISDLKISDYLVDVYPGPQMTYADALVLAMKKEKAAFRLYLDLASLAVSNEMKDVFNSLAQEEARHKLRFEIEYDENILREN
ncbi:MAG: ferritin family protein [Bacteroidales bacterium]|nr:ferritin family protein [Bacteroidales bacterium]MBK9357424.1 ferritin family protein [Bacteroidales bacterium]